MSIHLSSEGCFFIIYILGGMQQREMVIEGFVNINEQPQLYLVITIPSPIFPELFLSCAFYCKNKYLKEICFVILHQGTMDF